MQNQDIIGSRPARRFAGIAVLLAFALLSVACGGAQEEAGFTTGIGPGTELRGLQILTASVPSASVGAAYDSTQLVASGANGPLTWGVVDGDLPPGMTVTTDGMLFGTPLSAGFFAFTVEAADGLGQDTQMLGVAVETFGAYIESGLNYDDAWAGESLVVRFSGAGGDVTVSQPRNGSGGTVVEIDPLQGEIVYMPGQVFTSQVTDELRITDTASGEFVDIEITVRPNPMANHIARFATTDVWKVDFDRRTGAHAYSSDWHASLARLGLRNPASTGPGGTEVDRLCDTVCRVEVLRHLNPHFLRNPDGSGSAEALGISFPYEHLAGYATVDAGGRVAAQPYAYNVIALVYTGQLGIFGSAYVDDVGNPQLEHVAPGGEHELGAFVNRITDAVSAAFDTFGTELTNQPVSESDLETLKGLLHGATASGPRADALRYTIRGFAKSTAAVVAHEIGHCLGLTHTSPTRPGSTMNYATVIHEQATTDFLPDDLAKLRIGLPGPGRATSALSKALVSNPVLPDHGVRLCED